MLDIVIFVTLLVMAVKACKSILGQSSIFIEFGQSKVLAILVFLYPLGPLIMIFAASYLPIILVFGLAISCYVPALVIARRQTMVFQMAGTDKIQKANDALTSVVSGALIGLIYLFLVIVLTYAISIYAGV